MPVQRHVPGSAARGVDRDHDGELPRPPRQRQSAGQAGPITARELDLAANGLTQVPISHLRLSLPTWAHLLIMDWLLSAQPGPLVEPAGPGLVPAPPPGPGQVVADALPGASELVDDALDLGGGERDQPGVFGWQVVG